MMAKTAMTVAAMSTAKPSASRTAVRLKTSATIVDAVAGTPGRVDQIVGEGSVDLGTQARNMRFDDAGLGIEVKVPDALEQHRARDDAALIAHEEFKQAKLARLQVDHLAAAADGAANEIHLEIGDAQNGLLPLERRPPGESMEPGQELGEGEGLGDIVVAARLEPIDTIIDAAQRCQEQDRDLLADAAQRPDEMKTVDPRKHAVDDDDVVILGGGLQKAITTIGEVVDRVTLLGQSPADVGCRVDVVFDDENPHRSRSGAGRPRDNARSLTRLRSVGTRAVYFHGNANAHSLPNP